MPLPLHIVTGFGLGWRGVSSNPATLSRLHARVEAESRCRLYLTTLVEDLAGFASQVACQYPINALRNAALDHTSVTEHVLLLDIDFVCGQGTIGGRGILGR